eukprot:64413_1
MNVLQCDSIKRIKLILNRFQQHSNDNCIDMLIDIFIKNNYTNSDLLNDFHHVKTDHNIENDYAKFAEISKYIITKDSHHKNMYCCAETCKSVKNHYRDRSKINQVDQQIKDKLNNDYTLDLISRIHVYFIHSYDIDRLTLHEINLINEKLLKIQKLDEEKEFDTELLNDIKLEMMADMVNNKKNKLNVFRRKQKFIETKFADVLTTECNSDFVSIREIHTMLENNNVHVELQALKLTLLQYEYDKHSFINELIDTNYKSKNGTSSLHDIIIDTLHCTDVSTICECILYKYFKKTDLNHYNFINIASIILETLSPNIKINEFANIAKQENITGKMFVKGHIQFKNSVQFAKLFKSLTGCKKKHLTQVYARINKWVHFKLSVAKVISKTAEITPERKECSNTSVNSEEKKYSNIVTSNSDYKNEDINFYQLGTRFYFWKQMKEHKHYINRKYSNLKEEMLQNKLISFDAQRWNQLIHECHNDVQTNAVKNIKSNGYYLSLYGIKMNSAFSIQHLCALKLYTDYTKECTMLNSVLRSSNIS